MQGCAVVGKVLVFAKCFEDVVCSLTMARLLQQIGVIQQVFVKGLGEVGNLATIAPFVFDCRMHLIGFTGGLLVVFRVFLSAPGFDVWLLLRSSGFIVEQNREEIRRKR